MLIEKSRHSTLANGGKLDRTVHPIEQTGKENIGQWINQFKVSRPTERIEIDKYDIYSVCVDSKSPRDQVKIYLQSSILPG